MRTPDSEIVCYIWQIEKTSFWQPKIHGLSLISPNVPDFPFTLELFPMGEDGSSDRIDLFLQWQKDPSPSTSFEVTIEDIDWKVLLTVPGERVTNKRIKLTEGPRWNEIVGLPLNGKMNLKFLVYTGDNLSELYKSREYSWTKYKGYTSLYDVKLNSKKTDGGISGVKLSDSPKSRQ